MLEALRTAGASFRLYGRRYGQVAHPPCQQVMGHPISSVCSVCGRRRTLTKPPNNSMSDPNETYAYFTISGPDLDPSEISRQVGILTPDAWKKGELNPHNGRERMCGRWSLKSRLPRSEELEAHIADVLAQLAANPAAIQKISLDYGGCMQLVGYFHSNYSGLHLSQEIIQGLARYSLSVDHDFYYLHSDAREDANP